MMRRYIFVRELLPTSSFPILIVFTVVEEDANFIMVQSDWKVAANMKAFEHFAGYIIEKVEQNNNLRLLWHSMLRIYSSWCGRKVNA